MSKAQSSLTSWDTIELAVMSTLLSCILYPVIKSDSEDSWGIVCEYTIERFSEVFATIKEKRGDTTVKNMLIYTGSLALQEALKDIGPIGNVEEEKADAIRRLNGPFREMMGLPKSSVIIRALTEVLKHGDWGQEEPYIYQNSGRLAELGFHLETTREK